MHLSQIQVAQMGIKAIRFVLPVTKACHANMFCLLSPPNKFDIAWVAKYLSLIPVEKRVALNKHSKFASVKIKKNLNKIEQNILLNVVYPHIKHP